MSRLQNWWYRMFDRVLIGLLALLGFAGCDRYGPDEYGTPTAEYRLKGKVVDVETQKPIVGVQVVSGILDDPDHYLSRYQTDTVYSNGKGEFEVEYVHYGSPGKVCRVIWEDIRETPVYKKDSTDIQANGNFVGKSGSWYRGRMDLTIQIEAQKKNP